MATAISNDVHGNGLLYGEPRTATTIECIDCHGTIYARPKLITSGNGGPVDLRASNTPWGPRFFWEGNALYQRSSMSPDVRWEIPQTIDTIDPASSHYNAKSAYAKTLQRDGITWGAVIPRNPKERCKRLAHDNSAMDCQICHSSWATTCFGCHLPMKANQRVPLNKFEGVTDRNFTTYNPQVVRDDVFMLGLDGSVKKNRLAVIRSSSAVIVSSQNANREWVYSQQQTISAEGYSGQAFNPHFPHTTSGVGTTKNCEDCHLSKKNDNNAWMASLLGFGTGTVNFFGRYAYVGEGQRRSSTPSSGRNRTNRRPPSAVICKSSRIRTITENMSSADHDSEGSQSTRARHSRPRLARRISLHRERLGRFRGFRRCEH